MFAKVKNKISDYIIKGLILDDERLKNPDQPFDYFEELIRQIQNIRKKLPQRAMVTLKGQLKLLRILKAKNPKNNK